MTNTPTVTNTPAATITPNPLPAILVGAGDISVCDRDADDQTSELLASIPGEIFTLGDNSNEKGTMQQFAECFDYSWGRYMDRLHPVPGNHDYSYNNGASYFDYFGSIAGEYGKGYYSYDVGAWHIIAINSMTDVEQGSEQLNWLSTDLATHPSQCTLAYWHHSRWSSGGMGNSDYMAPVMQTLYDYGADVVLSGHNHNYERFAPQNPDGVVDYASGIREFVVGTGGATLLGFNEVLENSEVRDSSSFGVLKLQLYSDWYSWEFLPVNGNGFHDSGSESCH